jgi:hypothetical protein
MESMNSISAQRLTAGLDKLLSLVGGMSEYLMHQNE